MPYPVPALFSTIWDVDVVVAVVTYGKFMHASPSDMTAVSGVLYGSIASGAMPVPVHVIFGIVQRRRRPAKNVASAAAFFGHAVLTVLITLLTVFTLRIDFSIIVSYSAGNRRK